MKTGDDDNDFLRKLGNKADRKLKAQQRGKPKVLLGLGFLGIVGWSSAVPVLMGLVLGWWLDQCCPGRYGWTLNLLMAGLFIGCINVIHWISKEYRDIHDDEHKENPP